MIGNSLINAFKVLRKKPMVLLLLFPVYSVAPFLLLLFPGLENKQLDSSATTIIMLILLAFFFVLFIGILIRSVFLIPPAMELLHDGAAGEATPKGWFVRGLKKHWWKRITLGVIEETISSIASLIFQMITSLCVPLLALSGGMGRAADSTPPTEFIIIFVVLVICAYLAIAAFLFLLQNLSAFILAALADRSIGKAFKAVFSKLGFKKFLKLLGGKLLIGAASMVIVVVLLVGYSIIMAAFSITNITGSHAAMIIFSIIISSFIFLFSYIEVYRFSFDFCVFQDFKNAETNNSCGIRKAGDNWNKYGE